MYDGGKWRVKQCPLAEMQIVVDCQCWYGASSWGLFLNVMCHSGDVSKQDDGCAARIWPVSSVAGHSLRFGQTAITSAVPRLAVIFKVVACLKGAKIGQERVRSNFDPSILPEHKLSESLKANRHPKARTYLDGTQLGMR